MNDAATPLVSVVIPTYNHAHFLGRALQSVIDQTYTNWEAIVIDNHSTDNTDEVMASFADPRITYLKIHNNGVIASSRNAGIQATTGEWVAFLDSDDLWYPRKLEIVINSTRDDLSTDVCSTDEMQINLETGIKVPLIYGPFCHNFYRELLIKGNRLSTSATLVKRKFLTKHGLLFRENKEFVTAEDYDFWMLLALAGANFKFISSIQGEYTIHMTNASGQDDRHQKSALNVLLDHVYNQQDFQHNKDKLWRYINSGIYISNAKNMFKSNKYFSGIECLVEAIFSSQVGTINYIFYRLLKRFRSQSQSQSQS
jgi:glycosyltransferase involved in cell wall biosynthesis